MGVGAPHKRLMSKTPSEPPAGRTLTDPAAAAYRAELLALDKTKPVTVLTQSGDSEALAFGEEIAALLRTGKGKAKREVKVQPVNFDPPFRGLQMYDGDDQIQIAVGHSMTHGPSFLWPLNRT